MGAQRSASERAPGHGQFFEMLGEAALELQERPLGGRRISNHQQM